MWIVLLSTKDGKLATIKNVQVVAERKSDRQWHALCIDCGGEFTANDFKEYFMELGVQCQLTMPYSSPQNGIIERRNQTLMGAAHSMLKAKDLSITFWGGGHDGGVCSQPVDVQGS
jgi:transposase InsO family protein